MQKLELLNDLASTIARCTQCELHRTRTKTVFGKGNIDSPVVLIGEAPGQNEDLSGDPFMGRSGKLLDKMIESAGLLPTNVYITNTVRCRPPNNRRPDSEEVEMCRAFLVKQLELIQPRILVTVGATATDALLGPGAAISKRRGIWTKWNNYDVIPTYHPSYCLRSSSAKDDVIADLRQVAVLFGTI